MKLAAADGAKTGDKSQYLTGESTIRSAANQFKNAIEVGLRCTNSIKGSDEMPLLNDQRAALGS